MRAVRGVVLVLGLACASGGGVAAPPPPPPPSPDAGAVAVATPAAAPAPGPAGPDAWDRLPYQRWPEVPGRVVGLLYEGGHHAWGATIDHMKHTRGTPYVFSFDGSSPYALYFESDGEGRNLLRNWSVPTPTGEMRFDAAMFDSRTPNRFGLSRRVHVVQLEVNRGRGGRGLHFVATEGSVQPVDVEPMLLAMRARFDAELGVRGQLIESTFEASRARAVAQGEGLRARQRDDGGEVDGEILAWPTWLSGPGQLRVVFVYVRRGEVRVEEPPPRVDCPPGAPCARPAGVIHTFGYGVTFGATYTVDASGTLIAAELIDVAERTRWD